MDPKRKVSLATPKVLSPEIQREADKLQKVFVQTEEYLESLRTGVGLAGKSINLSVQARKEANELLMNKGHNGKVHRETLKKYCQSIAFAPQGTEELVLAYGNRSALLMHLQFYEQALVDIDTALQLSKSEDYKKKLQVRRDKCSGLLDEQNLIKSTSRLALTERKDLDKMRTKLENFQSSATVSCAADCVGLGYNDVFGRHLVATRDIRPGEIVLIDKGYACSPILSELHLVCSHCTQIAWNGIPCEECALAIYCSEDCKNEAFKDYHDIECPVLMYFHPIIFNTENGVYLVTTTRLLITALRKEGFESVIKEITEKKDEDDLDGLLTESIFRSDGFKACYNLSTWVKDVGAQYEKLESQVSQILYLLMNYTNFPSLLMVNNSSADKTSVKLPKSTVHGRDSKKVDPEVLLKLKKAMIRIKSVAATNGHPMQSGTTQCGQCTDVEDHKVRCHVVRGNAITACCSLINHSCTPNVFYLSAPKRRFIVFSSCPIKKGEMLCISYKSIMIHHGNAKTRHAKLNKFNCKCRACLDNVDMNSCTSDFQKDMNKIRAELKRKISASAADSFYQLPQDSDFSEKKFREMVKISELLYKQFNYFKAFFHTMQCNAYIETSMAKMYKDKISMPNDC